MILLIDNYDSFVHNLARYVRRLGWETEVVRNDIATPEFVAARKPDAIMISPGPCAPDAAGQSVEVVRQLADEFPMLGVCLGHQSIVQAFGGKIERAHSPVHGQTSAIYHDGGPLFSGVDNPFAACRYHSLVAARRDLPECLRITAWTDGETIMAVEHISLPICGIQFHPESVLTRDGMKILGNYFDWAGLRARC